MTGTGRRIVLGAAVGLMLASSIGSTAGARQPAAAGCATDVSPEWPIERIAGPDRYGTAACVALAGHPDGAPTVILARGDAAGGFADALAGTVLAHHLDAPIVLTLPDRLPDATRGAIGDLGATEVVILGGPRAVSAAVEAEVAAMVDEVRRVRGDTRADTAAQIAEEVGGTAAFVVNGRRPADALAAGAAAARSGAALLLTDTEEVPSATVAALTRRTDVTIVGGTGVVDESAAARIRGLVEDVRRLGGPDRFETAATVARVHGGDRTVHVVGGADANLVDAIAAGVLAAAPGGGPVIYSGAHTPSRGTDRWLRLGALDGAPTTRLIGGTASLADDLVAAFEDRYREAEEGGPAAQIRGMWVHLFDDALKTRAGIERALNTAAAANLNTVIVQAARRHDAFYDSDVLPATTDPDLEAGLDMLGELIPAAHARGLQVHVWYSVMPSTHPSMDDEDLGPDHINTQHGYGSDDPWMASGNSSAYQYLDPAIPGVQDHVAAMLREVAERYDVDGVHLDYLRYQSVNVEADDPTTPVAEQHPVTEARYDAHAEAGESMTDFLRAQTRDLVRRIYLEVAEANPDAVVSGALIAQGSGPVGDTYADLRNSFHGTKAWWQKAQDWPSWIDEGILDHAFVMDYFREYDPTYAQWYDDWVRFTDAMDAEAHVSAIGQGSYLNCVGDSLSQIDDSLRRLDGAMIYSYQGDVSSRCGEPRGSLLSALVATRFADPAPVPPVPRKQNPARGHVLVAASDGAEVTLTPTDGGVVTRRADATGHAGFPWVRPGRVEIRVDGGPPVAATVRAGEVARVTAP